MLMCVCPQIRKDTSSVEQSFATAGVNCAKSNGRLCLGLCIILSILYTFIYTDCCNSGENGLVFLFVIILFKAFLLVQRCRILATENVFRFMKLSFNLIRQHLGKCYEHLRDSSDICRLIGDVIYKTIFSCDIEILLAHYKLSKRRHYLHMPYTLAVFIRSFNFDTQ